MKDIKFGLIGCGRISKKHFEAIAKISNAKITSCSDIIESRAKEACKNYNIITCYTDYIKMMDNEDLDAVLICTPSGMHPEMGIKAAERKINVITEKPMAIDLRSADDLVKACDQNKVKLFVIKQNRLNPSIQLLKKAIDKGRFGRLFSATITVRWTRPQVYYDLAEARQVHNVTDTALVRIEQLYPFPHDAFKVEIERYRDAKEIVWCQEEPGNQGAWHRIQHYLHRQQRLEQRLSYALRASSASPATGYAALHAQRQKAVIDAALAQGG